MPQKKHRNAAQITEVINRSVIISLSLRLGYNAYLPVYDGGIDLILYRESDESTLNVQLKSRWTIDKKYLGRNIHIAFPIAGTWHLVPHDTMVEHARTKTNYLNTASWKKKGTYNSKTVPKAMVALYDSFRMEDIGRVADEEARRFARDEP